MKLEAQLKELEEITKKLESDNLLLEEAIALFEQGMTLAASVHKQLSEAKLCIDKVVEQAEETFSLEPLDLGKDGEGS
jgi:exodeoxyribonuclease VII small subunit